MKNTFIFQKKRLLRLDVYLYHVTSGPEDDVIVSAAIDGAAATQRSIEDLVVEHSTPCRLMKVGDDGVLETVVQLDASWDRLRLDTPWDRLRQRFV